MCIQLVCKGIFFDKPPFAAVGMPPSQWLSFLLRPACLLQHQPPRSLHRNCISGLLPYGPKPIKNPALPDTCGPCLLPLDCRLSLSWSAGVDFALLHHFDAPWRPLVQRYPTLWALSLWRTKYAQRGSLAHGRARMVVAFVSPTVSEYINEHNLFVEEDGATGSRGYLDCLPNRRCSCALSCWYPARTPDVSRRHSSPSSRRASFFLSVLSFEEAEFFFIFPMQM